MNKEDLLKIYKNIFDVTFNPNRDSDMKNSSENEKEFIIKEIIEYIQSLSESLLNLYQDLGHNKNIEETNELAIKYVIEKKWSVLNIITKMYGKYSKNIVSNFEKNMLKFFLKPDQKVENYPTVFEILKYNTNIQIK